jgi:hypothetical protein
MTQYSTKYFREEIDGVTDFRFARKELTKSGKLWYGTDDYLNKVISVGNMAENDQSKGISYDYQLHFRPVRRDVRDINNLFLAEGLNSFKKEIEKG